MITPPCPLASINSITRLVVLREYAMLRPRFKSTSGNDLRCDLICSNGSIKIRLSLFPHRSWSCLGYHKKAGAINPALTKGTCVFRLILSERQRAIGSHLAQGKEHTDRAAPVYVAEPPLRPLCSEHISHDSAYHS